jgi:hypothetical protein
MSVTSETRKGGSWLLEDTPVAEVFTPEKRSDEHHLMAQTTDEFIDKEVVPNLDRLEAKDWQLARTLIAGAVSLGCSARTSPRSTAAWISTRCRP